jgi:hypothetical protein
MLERGLAGLGPALPYFATSRAAAPACSHSIRHHRHQSRRCCGRAPIVRPCGLARRPLPPDEAAMIGASTSVLPSRPKQASRLGPATCPLLATSRRFAALGSRLLLVRARASDACGFVTACVRKRHFASPPSAWRSLAVRMESMSGDAAGFTTGGLRNEPQLPLHFGARVGARCAVQAYAVT